MRIANTLKAAGASGLLLGVSADSDLLSMAKELREKPQTESPRSRFALPVLLVPEKSLDQNSIRWNAPATIVTEFPMRNVIGKLEGSDPALKNQAILFTAHLDHLGTKPGLEIRFTTGRTTMRPVALRW